MRIAWASAPFLGGRIPRTPCRPEASAVVAASGGPATGSSALMRKPCWLRMRTSDAGITAPVELGGANVLPATGRVNAENYNTLMFVRCRPRRDCLHQQHLCSVQILATRTRTGEVPHPHDHQIARRNDVHVLQTGTPEGEGIARQRPHTTRVH